MVFVTRPLRLLGASALGVVLSASLLAAPSGAAEPAQQWLTGVGGSLTAVGNSQTLFFGTTGVTATVVATSRTGTCSAFPGGQLSGANATTFLTPDPPAGSVSVVYGCSPGGSLGTTVTFSTPLSRPVLHVVNLDASKLTVGGTSTTGAPITLSVVSANPQLGPSGNTLNPTTPGPINPGCQNGASNPNGACGSVVLTSATGLIQSFTLLDENPTAGGDGWAYSLSFPTATVVDDTPATSVNTPVTFDPLANDGSANGATLVPTSVVLLNGSGTPVTTLTNVDGTYTVNTTTGAITFTPATGFIGTAAPVPYRVTDSNGGTSTATITTTVTNNSQALPDAVVIAGGTPTTFNPLANDVPPGGGSLDPTSVRLLDSGGNLTTTLSNADGTYTVNTTNGQVTFTPSVTFTGPSTPVTYRVTDSFGTTRTAPITVSVAVVGIPLVSGAVGGVALVMVAGGFLVVRRRRRIAPGS